MNITIDVFNPLLLDVVVTWEVTMAPAEVDVVKVDYKGYKSQ